MLPPTRAGQNPPHSARKIRIPITPSGQAEAIEAVLQGRDTLVVQPTGSGKSAIYQIAGLLIHGATVVISPLIALQKDQVDSIAGQDLALAVAVNSTRPATEARENFDRVAEGAVEYLFLAPEQLEKQQTIDRLKNSQVSLFVVDEAHSISEWGHDFRPDYLGLGRAIEDLGHPTVLALTATATARVRAEIAQRLNLRDPLILVQSFDRPNISLRVDHFKAEDQKLEALVRRVRFAAKPGIVYVATRKTAETIMGALAEQGIDAVFYHAGLRARDRESIQERFMSGSAEVIVATSAFGMGIDKANVRFVYHYDIPESLDAYYQQIGRAGRDGDPSEAVLFYRAEDLAVRRFQAGGGRIRNDSIAKILDVVDKQQGQTHPAAIAKETGLSKRKITLALERLQEIGAVETGPGGQVALTNAVTVPEAVTAAAQQQDRWRAEQRRRLDQMQQFAEISSCRRRFLLEYFGEQTDQSCGNCDNCAAPAVDPAIGTRREVA